MWSFNTMADTGYEWLDNFPGRGLLSTFKGISRHVLDVEVFPVS